MATDRGVPPGLDIARASLEVSRRNNIKKKGAVIDTRANVTSGAEVPKAQITDKPKTHWEVQMISMAVHRHSVLTDLTEDAREEVINSMKYFQLNADEIVFEQGGLAIYFFVVASGSLEVVVNNVRVNVMKTGDSFGELALLHNTPRSATVRTLERATLWGVDRKAFKEAVEQVNVKNYNENKAFLDSVPIFNVMTPEEKENLLAVVTTQRFLSGKKIVAEGEKGDLFYLIKEGTVACSAMDVEIRKMEKGEYFGEQALLYNTLRTATVTAVDNVRVLSIGREQLREVLGSSLQRIIYRNTQRIALDKSPVLSKLTPEQKEKLITHIEICSYQDDTVIIPYGTSLSSSLLIVLKGKLKTASGVYADTFSVVGERHMMEQLEELTEEEVLADGFTDVAIISKEVFESTLGGNIVEISTRNDALAVLKKASLFRGFSADRLLQLLEVTPT
jgi:cGMP-dependent protein kinase